MTGAPTALLAAGLAAGIAALPPRAGAIYAFVAAWSPERQDWIVTGFRQRSLDCALGGLS